MKKAILRAFDNNTDPWLKHASKRVGDGVGEFSEYYLF